METYFEARPKLVEASAIALGFFDGVHPGHRVVIETAVSEARRLGVKAGVVTFKDHPRALTRGQSPMLLTVIEQRLALFEALGVEVALVLSFTEELCLKSPQAYVEDVLVGAMGARSISVGHNHHFGKDREGDADLLRSLGKDLGFSVNAAEMVHINGKEVSSSRIRSLVAEGKMQEALELLCHPFAVLGEVSRGDGRGRTIGVPTANLDLYQYQMIPKKGVYAGRARIHGANAIDCVINVGTRPTFKDASGGDRPTVEAHLLDCDMDLYGKSLEITFLEFLRDERKFAGAEELTAQIKEDIEKARNFLRRDQKGEKLPA
ncbi:MAG: bifunctional riboflavin kinase/FAD synthetase [Cyanobacteria bacterium HKST-UBA02]|nr:bifunctional riboflavin kinase/FAD synthetase [Cyanobacteria bacterium HKST-UBA02]